MTSMQDLGNCFLKSMIEDIFFFFWKSELRTSSKIQVNCCAIIRYPCTILQSSKINYTYLVGCVHSCQNSTGLVFSQVLKYECLRHCHAEVITVAISGYAINVSLTAPLHNVTLPR